MIILHIDYFFIQFDYYVIIFFKVITMSFGNRLKNLRIEKHLSQAVLAQKLGISTNAISQYETNKRFPDKQGLISICKFFCVTSDYLLGLSDIPRPSLPLIKLSESCKTYSDTQIAAINKLIAAFNNKSEK